ncbi:hypothetical protein ES703_81978 [subsurface metagenome]
MKKGISKLKGSLVGNIYAFRGAYKQQFQMSLRTLGYLNYLITGIPMVAVLAWVALQSKSALAFALISIGTCFMIMWNSAVARVGRSTGEEIERGIFHINLLSKTPVSVIMLGKAISYMTFTAISGTSAFLVILAVTRKLPEVGNLPALIVSTLIAMFAMISVSLIFAPLAVLADRRGGFFNAILPFGAMFSGFLYPISVLPNAFQVIARMLPTPYAMDGIIRSIQGQESIWGIIGNWGTSLGLSLLFLFVAYFLFKLVESRIRITGVLSRY